jgi:hypothetical protein
MHYGLQLNTTNINTKYTCKISVPFNEVYNVPLSNRPYTRFGVYACLQINIKDVKYKSQFKNFVLTFWKVTAFMCRLEISRDFTLFQVDFKCPNCVSAANAIRRDNGIRGFGGESVLVNYLLDVDIFTKLITTRKQI